MSMPLLNRPLTWMQCAGSTIRGRVCRRGIWVGPARPVAYYCHDHAPAPESRYRPVDDNPKENNRG